MKPTLSHLCLNRVARKADVFPLASNRLLSQDITIMAQRLMVAVKNHLGLHFKPRLAVYLRMKIRQATSRQPLGCTVVLV